MSEPVLSRKRQGAQDAVDTQADEHLFDYLREDLLDLVFFARQGLHPDIHSAALLTTPYVCLMRRGHPLSERAAALGPLEREDLEAFPQVLINAQPDRYRAPNSPGNGWFNPKIQTASHL